MSSGSRCVFHRYLFTPFFALREGPESSDAEDGLCGGTPPAKLKDKLELSLLITPRIERTSLRPKYADALALVSKEQLRRFAPVNVSQNCMP